MLTQKGPAPATVQVAEQGAVQPGLPGEAAKPAPAAVAPAPAAPEETALAKAPVTVQQNTVLPTFRDDAISRIPNN